MNALKAPIKHNEGESDGRALYMPFYPDIIMAPKIWLSPRNVTLENVTTYFVRQMNRPLGFYIKYVFGNGKNGKPVLHAFFGD